MNEEIEKLTGALLNDVKKEPKGFYSYYEFLFDFNEYWNVGYQND